MAESTFFKDLKKLFQTTAVITIDKDGKRSVADVEHRQQTNLSSLRDRYTKIQSSFYEQAGGAQSMAYQQVRREVFRDFDAMDNDPIIASALDIYADECLAGETIIPLLDGTKRTIKDLYESNETDIWLYGLDDKTNTFTPVKADKVAYNGKKQLYQITFDDGTKIKCTSNHIWIGVNGKQTFTDELKVGDGVLALTTKLSDYRNMNGYEMIWNGKTFDFVHRVVGNSVDFLIEQKNKLISNHTKILHHNSFNKLNNSPNSLSWMNWVEHNKTHASFNKHLWNAINSDSYRKNDYYDKLIKGQQKYWKSENGKLHSSDHSTRMKEYMASLTQSERNEKYGHAGKSNPMYKKGYKVTGAFNGRYDHNSLRIDEIDTKYVKSRITENPVINILSIIRKELGVNKHVWNTYISNLLDEYQCNSSKTLINKILSENHKLISEFRIYCNENYNPNKRFTIGEFCKNKNISKRKLRRTILSTGCKTLNEFATTSNHKIIAIEKVGIEDVYDIVNAGDNHIYALEANDGSKLYTHNSTLKDEFGDVMTIRSDNAKVQDLLQNLFYDILNVEFNLWPWVRNMPVKYDTAIPLLNGETITIEELSKRIKSNEELYVYSVQDDTNNIVPGKVVWCDKNYTSGKIIKVNFDDDTYIETAPEHPFILRNGSTKRADELNVNDSLMPFYRKLQSSNNDNIKDYEVIYNNGTNSYEFTHRVISNEIGQIKNKEQRTIHHSDFNKYNNSPTNLELMTWNDHKLLHASHCKELLHTPEITKKRVIGIDKWLRSDERRERMSIEMSGIYPTPFEVYNNSNEHKSHNKIRSTLKSKMWKDPIRRKNACENMKLKWSEFLINKIQFTIDNNTTLNSMVTELIDNTEFITEFNKINTRKCTRSSIYTKIKELQSISILNHKVKSIETITQSADVYCMTVVGMNGEDDRHNFATCGKDINGDVMLDSGVFVKNCKYGDFFLGMEIAEGKGIVNVTPHSVYNTERMERTDPKNPSAVKFKITMDPNGKQEYDNFEIAHFRLLSDTNWLPYGKAMIENGRRLWKQLSLMEDAMLIHRIMRAPEKRVFKIDIGNIKPTEVDNYMQKIINKMKKVPFMDSSSGDYNLKYNMQNLTEDFYLPVRGSDSGTEIDNIGGLEYMAIEDIDYLKDKLFAALKIPRAYLGYEENVCIVPETEIPLLDGNVKTVSELIDDFKNGIQNYTYSIDKDGNIVPGEIMWAGMTRKNAQLVRVHLDNGEYIDCTPDHNFMTRDGNWIESQNLKPNQSLMPLYLNYGGYKDGYTTVYNPATSKYELVHNIVANEFNIKQPTNVIHHKDFNKLNNNPENLDGSMGFWEHRNYHSKLTEHTLNSTENIKKRTSNPKWIESTRIAGKKGGNISGKQLGQWVKENGPSNKGVFTGKYIVCPTCGSGFYKTPSSNKKYCSKKCNTNERYNTKYNKITIEHVIEVALTATSFKDVIHKLNIDRNTLNRIFEHNGIEKIDFILKHMPLARQNSNFMRNYSILNHKVDRIEFLTEQKDTADLRINKFHNFATKAGVIIHNSGKATLAAEDVRFARTIERIQRTVISELTKIAIIHLYSNGIKDSSLTDFSIQLVNPSTIYEQERLELWGEKIRLATDAKDLNMLSKDWVYEKVFNMGADEQKVERGSIINDLKDRYRHTQIEEDGNDPAKQDDPTDVDESLEQLKTELKDKGGRPRESGKHGKDDSPYGRDPLGDKERKGALKHRTSERVASEYTKGIPIAKSQINETTSMLDDSNIIEELEN